MLVIITLFDSRPRDASDFSREMACGRRADRTRADDRNLEVGVGHRTPPSSAPTTVRWTTSIPMRRQQSLITTIRKTVFPFIGGW
jgi:hypothetical protein